MTEDRLNYGMQREQDLQPTGTHRPIGTVSAGTERTWSVLAHLSIFLNLFTLFLGPVAALVIWLVYKDRSHRVAAHAMQSLWYQIAWMAILAAGWTVASLLTLVLIGFLLMPVMLVLTFVPFVHAAYAAYKVSKDVDYSYLSVVDRAKTI